MTSASTASSPRRSAASSFPLKIIRLLLASLGVFAVGFVARPLGGLFFGHVGDHLGRRAAVLTSVVLMIIPTLLMALLPTYGQIGIAAPVLLVLLRLAQASPSAANTRLRWSSSWRRPNRAAAA